MSFTSGTKVLLASGIAVPIASLKPGEKVLATDARTGKTRAEPVSAVLVHHDTNRYGLKVRVGHRSAVIHTTRTHLFWLPAAHRWIKAAALRYGTHLRTQAAPRRQSPVGATPGSRTGWMWDFTVPGDHDFYVVTGRSALLVHNCPVPDEAPRGSARSFLMAAE
jgi:hypothetical protein